MPAANARPGPARPRRGLRAILPAVSTSFSIAELVVAVALIVAILLQSKGSGLGSVFGGDGSVFRTRRGAEKGLFNLTILLAIAFGVISVLNVALAHSVL